VERGQRANVPTLVWSVFPSRLKFGMDPNPADEPMNRRPATPRRHGDAAEQPGTTHGPPASTNGSTLANRQESILLTAD